jgi:hypothetical protein
MQHARICKFAADKTSKNLPAYFLLKSFTPAFVWKNFNSAFSWKNFNPALSLKKTSVHRYYPLKEVEVGRTYISQIFTHRNIFKRFSSSLIYSVVWEALLVCVYVSLWLGVSVWVPRLSVCVWGLMSCIRIWWIWTCSALLWSGFGYALLYSGFGPALLCYAMLCSEFGPVLLCSGTRLSCSNGLFPHADQCSLPIMVSIAGFFAFIQNGMYCFLLLFI